MAVAFEMRFAGATLEQHDQVVELMGFTPGGKGAPAGLLHWVTKTDDGIMVVDVWETAEAYQTSADTQIGPYMAQVGLNDPPEVRSYGGLQLLHRRLIHRLRAPASEPGRALPSTGGSEMIPPG